MASRADGVKIAPVAQRQLPGPGFGRRVDILHGDHFPMSQIEARHEKLAPQVMRSAPPMVNWRSRVKVSGVVTPSPVGVAML